MRVLRAIIAIVMWLVVALLALATLASLFQPEASVIVVMFILTGLVAWLAYCVGPWRFARRRSSLANAGVPKAVLTNSGSLTERRPGPRRSAPPVPPPPPVAPQHLRTTR